MFDRLGWATLLPAAAGIVLVVCGVHEWVYHHGHRYAPGVSGILTVGFLAGAAVAFAVALIAHELDLSIRRTVMEANEARWGRPAA